MEDSRYQQNTTGTRTDEVVPSFLHQPDVTMSCHKMISSRGLADQRAKIIPHAPSSAVHAYAIDLQDEASSSKRKNIGTH